MSRGFVPALMSGAIAPPANTVAPAVTGYTLQGQTLTTTNGTWTGSPSFARQWKRDGVAISAATGTTYVTQAADVGHAITCTVTGTNGGGAASATSNATTNIFTSTGLIDWVDFSQTNYVDTSLTTPAVADGDKIGGVKDYSGNLNHLVQATTGNKFVLKTGANGKNGLNTGRGTASSNTGVQCAAYAGGALTQPVTVVLVFKMRAVNTGLSVFDGGPSVTYEMGLLNNGGVWDIEAPTDTSNGAVDTNWHVLAIIFNGVTSKFRFDGNALAATSGTVGAHTMSGWTLGNSTNPVSAAASDTDFAEGFVYSGALSAGVITDIVSYLNAKWAVF